MEEKKMVHVTTSTGDALRVTPGGVIEIRDRDDKREWREIALACEADLTLRFLKTQVDEIADKAEDT